MEIPAAVTSPQIIERFTNKEVENTKTEEKAEKKEIEKMKENITCNQYICIKMKKKVAVEMSAVKDKL